MILIVACDPLRSATSFFIREKRKNKLPRDPITTTTRRKPDRKKQPASKHDEESASAIGVKDRCSTRSFSRRVTHMTGPSSTHGTPLPSRAASRRHSPPTYNNTTTTTTRKTTKGPIRPQLCNSTPTHPSYSYTAQRACEGVKPSLGRSLRVTELPFSIPPPPPASAPAPKLTLFQSRS